MNYGNVEPGTTPTSGLVPLEVGALGGSVEPGAIKASMRRELPVMSVVLWSGGRETLGDIAGVWRRSLFGLSLAGDSANPPVRWSRDRCE